MKNDFSQGKMWKNILAQAIPLTVAQAVQVLYNVVDRIYLGHLPGQDSLALTGVGLIFPIVALITAFCNLFASGGAPLCAMARGAGNERRAEKILNACFTMLLTTALVLTAVGYAFRRPILYAFGASDDTYPLADAYLTVYLSGTVFSMLATGLNGFINAQGFPRVGMVTINSVRVSKDLGYADIYVSVLSTEELNEESAEVQDTLKALRSASGFLRGQLGRAMKLRVIPQLRFHFDALQGQSRRIDRLIDQAVGKNPAVRQDDDDNDEQES